MTCTDEHGRTLLPAVLALAALLGGCGGERETRRIDLGIGPGSEPGVTEAAETQQAGTDPRAGVTESSPGDAEAATTAAASPNGTPPAENTGGESVAAGAEPAAGAAGDPRSADAGAPTAGVGAPP